MANLYDRLYDLFDPKKEHKTPPELQGIEIPNSKRSALLEILDSTRLDTDDKKRKILLELQKKESLIWTPDDIINKMETHQWKSPKRKDFTKTTPLTTTVTFEHIPQPKIFQEIEELLQMRQDKYNNLAAENKADRTVNFIIQIDGPPGSAKTTSANKIAESFPHSKIPFIRNLIPILITMNTETEGGGDAHGVCLRLLAKFFLEGHSGYAFSEVSNVFAGQTLEIPKVLAAIQKTIEKYHPDCGIVIIWDETSKIPEGERITILSALSGPLGMGPEKYCLIYTSLEPLFGARAQSQSGRQIIGLTLPPLPLDIVSKVFKKEFPMMTTAIERVLDFTNGHGRSVASLAQTLRNNIKDDGYVNLNQNSLLEQLRHVYFRELAGNFLDPPEVVVKTALKGKYVKLTDDIGGKTFDQWSKQGILVNSEVLHTEHSILPTISPFFLWLYCGNGTTSLRKAIGEFLNTSTDHAVGMERIHTQWEDLIRVVYEGSPITLGELYHLLPSHPLYKWTFEPAQKSRTPITGIFDEPPKALTSIVMSKSGNYVEIQKDETSLKAIDKTFWIPKKDNEKMLDSAWVEQSLEKSQGMKAFLAQMKATADPIGREYFSDFMTLLPDVKKSFENAKWMKKQGIVDFTFLLASTMRIADEYITPLNAKEEIVVKDARERRVQEGPKETVVKKAIEDLKLPKEKVEEETRKFIEEWKLKKRALWEELDEHLIFGPEQLRQLYTPTLFSKIRCYLDFHDLLSPLSWKGTRGNAKSAVGSETRLFAPIQAVPKKKDFHSWSKSSPLVTRFESPALLKPHLYSSFGSKPLGFFNFRLPPFLGK